MSLNDNPRIRQVLFLMEKNRCYKFDVNSNITVKGLKRMISAAANLSKGGLKIVHKGIDFSDNDEMYLSEINPDQQVVEFNVSFSAPSILECDYSKIKLRMGDYCMFHPAKYTYFYCYDCGSSICSTCFRGETHKNHNVIEKCDYLQDSRHLVELLFKDIGTFTSEIKFDKKAEAEELKKNIKNTYFPELHETLRAIEKKQIDLIDLFLSSCDTSFANIQQNAISLKDHCAVGLEKLKEEINIQDMVVDEEVFLIFDQKYKEMANEKDRIKEDQNKYEVLYNSLDLINDTVNKIHNDISSHLDAEKKNKCYDNMKTLIDSKTVGQVNKEEILEKVLMDVRPRLSSRKSLSALEHSRRMSSRSPLPRPEGINSIFNYNVVGEGGKVTETSNLNLIFPSKLFHGNEVIRESTSFIEEKSGSKETTTFIQSKSHTKEVQPVSLDKIIMKCATGSREVVVYDDTTNQLSRRVVEFPKLGNVSEFLPYCAWINYLGKLYISGGLAGNDSSSTSFFCYDYVQNSLVKLPDMNKGRHCHSMIFYNNNIYVVGGHDNTTVERYDVIGMKWTKLGNLNVPRQNAILHVYNDYLYAFFGYIVGSYVDTVEKLRLNNVKARWEYVPYKNPVKINLKVIGCGIVLMPEDKLYFFGGKGHGDQGRKNAFQFEFATNTFTNTQISLEDSSFFQESTLFKLDEETHGQFDTESGDHFLKLLLG